MIGSELLIDSAAKGLTGLITDTTKTGSGSVLGKAIKGLKDKSSQAIFQASRKYIENYQKRHCQLKVLGMREPVDLSAVYTGVKLLDSQDVLCFEIDALEDTFRQGRFRGYSGRSGDGEKHSGITIANQKQYLMVLGGPGAGKSTFLRKVGLEALRTFYYEKAAYHHRLIPVLLELKRFDTDNLDIAQFITDEFETCGFPEAETFTQNALAQGNLLILLDGLDEVPSAQLNNVLQTIRDFIDRYDDNRFMASCRVAASGYRDDAFRRFSDVTMADFDDEQIQQFIGNWFSSAQDIERSTAEKCWEVLKKPENQASKELAHTPLLLTYLCLVYDLSQRFPNNRSSLYKKALRILLEEWAAEKRILRDEIYEGLSIEQEEILLSEIAYEGMKADQLFFEKRKLSGQIKAFLASNLNAPKHLDSEAVLTAIEVQQGILVERAENTYSFSHLTLQEYLTAQYLIDNDEWQGLIGKNLADHRWREIFLLLPGLINGKTGADKLLLSMEQVANKYLNDLNLQKLVEWADLSTQWSNITSKFPKGVGAIYISHSSEIKRAFVLSNQRNFLSFTLNTLRYIGDYQNQNALFEHVQALAFKRVLNSDSSSTFNSNSDRLLDIDIGRLFFNSDPIRHLFDTQDSFSDVNLDEIRQSFNALSKKEPKPNASEEEKTFFLKASYALWFSALGVDSMTIMLSQSDLKSLETYAYICELMIRCKEGATRVSPEVWEDIESRILTVPATSEFSED